MLKEKTMGVTLLGWLLVVYFLYAFVFPITYAFYSLINAGIDTVPGGPIGSYHIFKYTGANSVLLGILSLTNIIQIPVSISSIVGGIGVFKTKRWARKFVLIVFSVSIVSLVVSFFIVLFEPELAKVVYYTKYGLLRYVILIPFNGLIISLLQFSKIKEAFEKIEPS